MNEPLSPDELLALGGLLRVLIRLDGTYSPEENSTLKSILRDVLAPRTSLFDAADPASGSEVSIWDLLGRAARELPDEAAVKRAAQAVVRADARDAIYAAVCAVAESDGIVDAERALLDWLAAAWELPLPNRPASG